MQPIVLASTFAQPEPAKPLRFDYSRSGNPTRVALEECLTALEGGNAAFAKPVRDFMTTHLVTVGPGAPLDSLFTLFDRGLVAIVCEGEKFFGLITRIDVINQLRRVQG